MQSKPDGKTKNSSSDRSKALPRSFQVLRRDGLVDFGEATPERLAASGRDQSGLFPVLTRGCRNFRFHARRESQEGHTTSSSPFDVSGPSFVRLRELWTLASELLLEPGPPFSSLNADRPPQVADGEPHTRTFWIRGGQRFPWPISKRRATTSSRGAMSASSSRTPRSRDKKSAQKPSRRDGRDQSQKQGARRPR